MSFTFNWPRFSDQFHYDAIQMLNTALNKGNKPPVIADKIEVVELEMGTQPPELEIRDIGDLTMDQFRGIFRLTYSGDAHIVLKTKVQANPLNHKQPDIHLMGGSTGMLAAKQPLVVPMLLRLSHFRLNAYVVLVVSKQKGITLVFKTDPLQNVDINSTFDSIAVIQKFIQREIEGQLRQMFREDLPGIIHRLSQQWVKAKVEAPYLSHKPPPPVLRKPADSRSAPDFEIQSTLSTANVGLRTHLPQHQTLEPLGPRGPRSISGTSIASITRRSVRSSLSRTTRESPPLATQASTSSDSPNDLENFDPTYGLRPEGLPMKSVFKGFSSLFIPNKGLADLAEEPSDLSEFDDASTSFDMVDWDDNVPDLSPPPSLDPDSDTVADYETIPAIGGGTITRPRVLHAPSVTDHQSQIDSPMFGRSRSHNSVLTPLAGQSTPLTSRASYNPYFPDYRTRSHSHSDAITAPGLYRSHSQNTSGGTIPRRPVTPDSLETQPSHSSNLSTPPSAEHHVHDEAIYMRQPPSERRSSISSSYLETSFQSSSHPRSVDPDPKIILRPSLNNTIHQLSTLSQSHHTLSPFTHSLAHFTVRSVPPRGTAGSTGDRQPVKAKRKRIYRLGGQKPNPVVVPERSAHEQQPPRADSSSYAAVEAASAEFDASDMDRYFRSSYESEDLSRTNHPRSRSSHQSWQRRSYHPP